MNKPVTLVVSLLITVLVVIQINLEPFSIENVNVKMAILMKASLFVLNAILNV